jgi:fructose-1,6-bisphosphatase/inositol monophosphatase family enzyme
MTAPLPRAFVATMLPALRQAAAVARALEGRVVNRPKEREATASKAALTVADTAAQETLLVTVLERFPFVSLEAEEDTPTVHRFPRNAEARVVIDPIDGTLHSYLEGRGPYAIMVGLVIADRVEAALVALPREGLFFDATRGQGARVTRAGGVPRFVRVPMPEAGQRILVSHELPEAARERLRARGYELVHGAGGAIAVAPLVPGVRAGLRVAHHGKGISVRGRIGALIATEAGAIVHSESGKDFPLELSGPAQALVVAARGEDMDALEEALAAARATA